LQIFVKNRVKHFWQKSRKTIYNLTDIFQANTPQLMGRVKLGITNGKEKIEHVRNYSRIVM